MRGFALIEVRGEADILSPNVSPGASVKWIVNEKQTCPNHRPAEQVSNARWMAGESTIRFTGAFGGVRQVRAFFTGYGPYKT
tara:strand:- start:273 stop:518 length:246 start_codon:yes stop_codon:yes gene_type:complete